MRWLAVLAICACNGSDAVEPLFAETYKPTYVEVRNCRASSDHDLNKIRVLADPVAMNAYVTRSAPFPIDSIVLKEEFDFADGTCSGAIVQWTVMKKTATGWTFQKVDKDRDVVSENEARCINCHAQCGVAPDGHDGTCAVP